MNNKIYKTALFIALIAGFVSCNKSSDKTVESVRYQFENILDIAYTPNADLRATGWFADAGSWVGYTIPEIDNWVNGFCGPFSLDMNRRQWIAKSAIKVGFKGHEEDVFVADSTNYFPGEIFISAHSSQGGITQTLNFIDAANALLTVETDEAKELLFTGEEWGSDIDVTI
ncbi:MAG TPA: glycoside hydrolase, partial [Bacteroidales bacterium]|nr:glycoside hydrolase [Bacteroidales bacterium]